MIIVMMSWGGELMVMIYWLWDTDGCDVDNAILMY